MDQHLDYPFSLQLKNATRWILDHLFSWGLLGGIYSITVAVVMQAFAELVYGTEIPLIQAFGVVYAVLLLPLIINFFPVDLALPVPAQAARFFFYPTYVLHESRKIKTWLTLALTVAAGAWALQKDLRVWIILCQIPCQRSLYSVHLWRNLGAVFNPDLGPGNLIRGLRESQTLQYLMMISFLGLTLSLSPDFALADWFKVSWVGYLSTMVSCSLALEGDSGRPWLVNMVSLAAGLIAGMMGLVAPWWLFLLVVWYFFKVSGASGRRFRSVEKLYEDALIP